MSSHRYSKSLCEHLKGKNSSPDNIGDDDPGMLSSQNQVSN